MKILKILTEEQQRAAIKLFHAVVDTSHSASVNYKDMLNCGVILVTQHGTLADLGTEAASFIKDTLGLKPVNWAQSFHKSWDKVATCSIEQLISEQLLNYFSTYGLESRGLRSLNYVPVEKILTNLDEKPAIEAFTVVHVLSVEELQEKLIDYLKNTKAPHRDAVECVKALLPLAAGIKVDDVKSFEIKIMYCDLYNLVPTEAQDFLRFAVFKATNGTTTTLVKDDETIGVLKLFARTPLAVKMFESADITSLSRSFYRFKPLFLAFKANEQLASVINKIRRLAVRNHQPVSGFTVSNLMNLLVQNRKSDAVEVISKADRRELIKLINFARQEISLQAHVYNIRNGKVFVKAQSDSTPAPGYQKNVTWLHEVCLNRLKELINSTFSRTVFYIPEGIVYAAPVSEKQMLDTLPYGSRILLPKDAKALCISGHWFNRSEFERVDLDFHLESAIKSIGWNSNYRTSDNSILFSGDMTDAPKPYGAVESVRISRNVGSDVPYVLSVNDYTGYGDIPYEILFTKDITSECNFTSDVKELVSAVVNPANAIAPAIKLRMNGLDNTIGYYFNDAFTICGGSIGGHRRIPDRELMTQALQAFVARYESIFTIEDAIALAGGTVVHQIPVEGEYVDLRLSNLTASTLFDVVDGKLDSLPLAAANTASTDKILCKETSFF